MGRLKNRGINYKERKMYKRIIITLLFVIFTAFFVTDSFATSRVYIRTCLTGGTLGCLDDLDGTLPSPTKHNDPLNDGDMAIVITFQSDGTYPKKFFMYTLDADSGLTESAPGIITPDTNAGTKRWILSELIDDSITASYLKLDASNDPLTGNLTLNNSVTALVLQTGLDLGSYEVRAETFESDVVTGTAPFTIASTTVVPNLNVDQLDNKDETAFLLTDGTRALGGPWNMNSQATTNVNIDSGLIDHEAGGLEADASLFNGLLKISGGATSAITDSSANWDAAFTHIGSNGSSHTFINQDVTNSASPVFTADNFSDGGSNAIITTTQETNFETAYTHSQSSSQAHSDYLINDGDDTTTGRLTTNGLDLGDNISIRLGDSQDIVIDYDSGTTALDIDLTPGGGSDMTIRAENDTNIFSLIDTGSVTTLGMGISANPVNKLGVAGTDFSNVLLLNGTKTLNIGSHQGVSVNLDVTSGNGGSISGSNNYGSSYAVNMLGYADNNPATWTGGNPLVGQINSIIIGNTTQTGTYTINGLIKGSTNTIERLANNTRTWNLAQATAFLAGFEKGSGGAGVMTITNGYGLRIAAWTDDPALMKITNAYGLWIGEQAGTTINNEIFLDGGGEVFFRDQNIHFGSLTDGHLDLTADISVDVNGDLIHEEQTGNTLQTTTLGVGVTTLAITKNVITLTGDGGANVLATITGGLPGQIFTIIFTDANITITDTDAHTANTVDLAGVATDLVSADDTTLQIVFNGTSWYEVSRSVN
jgi:hypothetical protein